MFARVLPTLIVVTCLIASWESYCDLFQVSPLILPAPSGIVLALWHNREEIGTHALSTMGVAVLGFSLSVFFAFIISIMLHFARWAERGFMPVFVASQTIPLIALAPLMILWFGFGLLPKVLLVILVTFFPMLISLLSGYRQTPQEFIDLLASMGASKWSQFRRARLPSARPVFLAGLRISATYAIVATIFAEYSGARRGLGIYILSAKNNFRADLVLAAVVISALLTLTLLGSINLIDRLTRKDRGRHHA